MRLQKKIKRDAVYALTRFMFWFLNRVPRSLAMFIGSLVGLASWQLLLKERHKVNRHLSIAFPNELTPSQRRTIGRAFFINSGKNLADVIRFSGHYACEIKPIVEIEGFEHFEAAYNRGKGLIGITGHIGNFELLAVHMAGKGFKIAAIGREMYDRRLDELLINNRRVLGVTNISTTDSPRVLLRWLKQGGAVGVLIDNDSHRVRSMHIPAFGRLSNTPIGQTIIAMKSGAALVPMACLRTSDDRYKIVVKPEVTIDHSATKQEQIYQATLKCTKELEEIVKAHPCQWAWNHNRWRTRPQNTP